MSNSPQAERSRELQTPELPEPAFRSNLELSVMMYVGGISALVIAGFAVYRFAIGNFLEGVVNAGIFGLLCAALLFGRKRGLIHYAMPLFGLAITVSCVLSSLMIGPNALLWAYLVLWVNHFILRHWIAILLNGSLVFLLAIQINLFSSLLHQISWVVVALLISGFALVFTQQLRRQRRLLEKLATRDSLTGTGNRRLMVHDLQSAVRRFKRTLQSSTLVVLDLDHFKTINDNHGHEAGDRALATFANSVLAALREGDGFYRMGGEEFVLFLPDMDEEAAKTALPELHQRLSGRVDGPEGKIRFSAGAAVLREGDSWSSWLARADNALYRAKHSGRDTLIIENGDSDTTG